MTQFKRYVILMTALDFSYSIGLRRLEFEVGNQELLGLINMGPPCLAPIEVLIEDICSWFHLLINVGSPCLATIGVLIEDICSWFHLFQFLRFSLIRKDCNKAALALAIEVLSSSFDQMWLDDHPDSITSIVQFDFLQ